jgi:hypothetical protein
MCIGLHLRGWATALLSSDREGDSALGGVVKAGNVKSE